MIFSSLHFFQKRRNKFDFTTCRLVFVRFMEESENTKKSFDKIMLIAIPKKVS